MDAMPGPQFNQDKNEKGWFARNAQKSVLYLIIALLVVGGYYFYRNYQNRQAILRPIIENQQSESPTASPSTTITSPEPSGQNQPVAIPEVKRQNSEIIAQAAKGNGATHLARQSLKEYLKDKTALASQLKPEQKIYIEDYLQKHVTHPASLKIGDQLTFSDTLINDAITQAQKLTDKQINNLHKYVLLAPSL